MSGSRIHKSLGKFKKTINGLNLEKRIAATKWLEGVIVAQSLTSKERDGLVKAANEYIGDVEEGKYADAVNSLIEYFGSVQKSARRALKKKGTRSIRNKAHTRANG